MIVVSVVFAFGYFYNDTNKVNPNITKVGSAHIKAPSGYQLANNSSSVFTNGNTYLTIKQENTTDSPDVVVSNFISEHNSTNTTASNITYEKTTIRKVTSQSSNNGTELDYWFEKDNKLFHVYTQTGNNKTDDTVKELFNKTVVNTNS